VAVGDTFYVFGAAVTDFNGVPNEDLAILVMFRKVLVNQLEESVTNFSHHVSIEGWVIPNYFTFSVISGCLFFG